MTVEERYFEALSTGKIRELETILRTADGIGLDVNTVDANGHNAYVIAINEGFDVLIKILLRYHVKVGDALLYAVETNAISAVNLLCSHAGALPQKECLEIVDCRCSTDEFSKFSTPIIQAALNNNFKIIEILLQYGVRVPDPEKDFEHFTAPQGTLERSKEMLGVYRALVSDAYISCHSTSPIQAAFELTSKMRSLSDKLVEFKSEFMELAHQVEEYAGKLVDQTRDTEEILTVLTYTEGQTIEPEISQLEMIDYAIGCSQKNFVAHANCQKVIFNQYYRHLVYLRDMSALVQVLIHLLVMVATPFLSIIYIIYPSQSMVKLLQVPYVKFFMSIGSEIMFLILVIYDSVSDSREGSNYTATQILITLWILGKTWAELERLTSNSSTFFGRNMMQSIYNFLILALLFAVFILRLIAYLQEKHEPPVINDVQKRTLAESDIEESRFLTYSIPELKDHVLLSLKKTEISINQNLDDSLDQIVVQLLETLSCKTPEPAALQSCEDSTDRLNLDPYDPVLVIEALYSFAIVLVFLRMSSIAVINEFVGPLQISLGGMVMDIAIFGVIYCVVWLAFAIGMNQLHAIFQEIDYETCVQTSENCMRGPFSSILASLETFYWALLGNIAFSTAYLSDSSFYLTEWVSVLVFACYKVIAVVILLNALIAMMSNTYCAVEENADIEWKFSRTATWMTYMSRSVTLPPPFNIFPCLWKLCKSTRQEKKKPEVQKNEVEYFQRKFQKLIEQLVERFVHESNAGEDRVSGGLSKRDLQSLKGDVVSFRYECGNLLDSLSRKMDETNRQTTLTRDKLEITEDIKTNAEEIHKKLTEQKSSFSDIHDDLIDLRNRPVDKPIPPDPSSTKTTPSSPKTIPSSPKTTPSSPKTTPSRPMKQQTSRVSVMSGLFEKAGVSGGGLSEEAKDIFK